MSRDCYRIEGVYKGSRRVSAPRNIPKAAPGFACRLPFIQLVGFRRFEARLINSMSEINLNAIRAAISRALLWHEILLSSSGTLYFFGENPIWVVPESAADRPKGPYN